MKLLRAPHRSGDGITTIFLSQGEFTQVDSVDDELAEFNWSVYVNRGCRYAFRKVGGRKGKKVILHREIAARMGLDLTNEIDHVDGNGLNNRRNNLRAATTAQNQRNQGIDRRNKSGVKGVWWVGSQQKWRAGITVDRKRYYLGSFSSKEDAAAAYDMAAARLHGEFARPNGQ